MQEEVTSETVTQGQAGVTRGTSRGLCGEGWLGGGPRVGCREQPPAGITPAARKRTSVFRKACFYWGTVTVHMGCVPEPRAAAGGVDVMCMSGEALPRALLAFPGHGHCPEVMLQGSQPLL